MQKLVERISRAFAVTCACLCTCTFQFHNFPIEKSYTEIQNTNNVKLLCSFYNFSFILYVFNIRCCEHSNDNHLLVLFRKASGIKFHTSSVLKNPALPEKKAIKIIPTDWILYEEMSRYERSAYIRCCTAISPITVALFTGPIKLPPESVRDGAKPHGIYKYSESCLMRHALGE